MASRKKTDSDLRKVQRDCGKTFVIWLGKRYSQPKGSKFPVGSALAFLKFTLAEADHPLSQADIVVACPAIPLPPQETWKFSGYVGGEAGKAAAAKLAEAGEPVRRNAHFPLVLMEYEEEARRKQCARVRVLASFEFDSTEDRDRFVESTLTSAGSHAPWHREGVTSDANSTRFYVEVEVPIEKLK